MRDLRVNRSNVPDLDRFGFRPLSNPAEMPRIQQRRSQSHSSRPKVSLSSSSSIPSVPAAAAAPPPPQRQAASQDNNEFLREGLQVHNELRRRHGVEPLRLNNDLSKLAQQWGKYKLQTTIDIPRECHLFLQLII